MPGQSARVIQYPAFGANVSCEGGQITQSFTDGTGTVHVFGMNPEVAKQIRDGLTKALSGIETAQVMPAENGAKLL